MAMLICDKKMWQYFSTLKSDTFLCLGGHTKVRVPGTTIARKNTSCVINK